MSEKTCEEEKFFCYGKGPKPKVVCLCGSTRFSQAFRDANLRETLAGNIVLTIGCDMRSDADIFAEKTESELKTIKIQLDVLHLHKIDLADEVLILNVGGYIGESTQREALYAIRTGKQIRYLEEHGNSLLGSVCPAVVAGSEVRGNGSPICFGCTVPVSMCCYYCRPKP